MKLKLARGSVQGLEELPEELKLVYRTVWEVPMRSLIDMAKARNAYIDQSQSLNLLPESLNILGGAARFIYYAWKSGLKTTYYLRSRPAAKISKTAVAMPSRTGSSDSRRTRWRARWRIREAARLASKRRRLRIFTDEHGLTEII